MRPVRVETPRLIIRSFTQSDIPAYAEIVSDPRVTRFLADGSPHSYREAEHYILDCIERDRSSGISRYAVTRKAEQDLIGFCGFKALPDYTDFGWRYAHRCWGQGIATEAALRMLAYGLEELRLANIAAGAYCENIASVAIIRKLGFTHIAHDRFYGKATIRYYQQGVTRASNETPHLSRH